MARQKTRRDENFPVGSLLLPRHQRADVHAYYTFARLADDIADSPDIPTDEKLVRLDEMERAVQGKNGSDITPTTERKSSQILGERLSQRGLDSELATDLLQAFRWDAENKSCRTWADLMNYCQFSACPVGRFLLALNKEEAAKPESDALSSALQVLNHIQDASEDWNTLNRLYIPTDWMIVDQVTPNDLATTGITTGLRKTLDRMLDNTDDLLVRAAALPNIIKNRGLASEAAFCLALAKQLSSRLRNGDPIATKISLSRFDWIIAGGRGVLRALRL
jgi:hydroxysqualene synthase